MNAMEFAELWRKERDWLVEFYLRDSSESSVGQKIAQLGLTESQQVLMREIVEGIVTDNFFACLMALDGAGSMGGVQQMYKVYDEDGNLISDCGELESAAFAVFHG